MKRGKHFTPRGRLANKRRVASAGQTASASLRRFSSAKIALQGLMLAMTVVLSALEHMLPALPLLPPGVRLGLANVIVMYCVFFVGPKQAAALNALKAFFVLLTRGPLAGLLSFCGGMLSVCVVIVLVWRFRIKISYAALSVAGACAHNLGQYAAVSIVLASAYLTYYLPVLLAAGLLTGLVTGALLKLLLPVFARVLGGRQHGR